MSHTRHIPETADGALDAATVLVLVENGINELEDGMHACGLKDKSVIVCLCDGHCVGRSESGAVAQPSAAGPPVASLGSPEIERPRDALARRRGPARCSSAACPPTPS